MSRNILFPVGRLVGGSLYVGQNKNMKGEPLKFRDGTPRVQWNFGVAIPKTGESHWRATAWGQEIWAEGAAASPAAHQSQKFAWKVKDGDDAETDIKGRRKCDREGYAGNWVVWLSGSFAPKIYNRDGTAVITEEGAVKTGYYVQAYGSVGANNSTETPGVFLNYSMIAFNAYGAEIALGPDAADVGFGKGPAPAGASAAPVGGMQQPPTPVGGMQQPPTPTAVTPAPNFLAPPPPSVKSGEPTAKAAGASVEQMLSWPDWTLELLIENGYVTR